MTNELIQYVRVNRGKNKGTPRGVVIAFKDTAGKVHVGWSYTATSKGDSFDKERGLLIARGRANKSPKIQCGLNGCEGDDCEDCNGNAVKIPVDVELVLSHMTERAHRYFKA